MTSVAGPSMLSNDHDQELLNWIHTNAFPSEEIHREIASITGPLILADMERRGVRVNWDIVRSGNLTTIRRSGKNQIIAFNRPTVPGKLELADYEAYYAIHGPSLGYQGVFESVIHNYIYFHPGIFDIINQEYNKRGYFFRYFGWINVNFDPVAAKLINLKFDAQGNYQGNYQGVYRFQGIYYPKSRKYTPLERNIILKTKERLQLTPDTFENGVPLLIPTTYKNVMNAIETNDVAKNKLWSFSTATRVRLVHSNSRDFESTEQFNGIHRYIGWSKEMLERAIIRSDLAVYDPNVKYTSPSNKIIPKSLIKGRLTGHLPGFNYRIKTKNLFPYMPLVYYASLFRKLFGTMTYIDWETICRNKLQKYDLLKFIAVNDFGLDYKYVRSLKYDQLCAVLTEESERRRRIRLGLGTEVGARFIETLYRPGSEFVRRQIAAPEFREQYQEPEFVPPEWQELANACANPDSVSKEYLAFIARRMGVRESLPKDLSGMSNDQICKSLLNYVEVVQSGRKPI